MTASYYWYDLETSGIDTRWDRIVQFAGIRTDLDLNLVGDEYCTYVQLPDDVLPNPEATLVTGITPALTRAEGVSEWQALTRINTLFSEPGTCVAGYNSLRFDDEFIRYGLYRLLMDPYAREWQNGNSRWDIIDLVRATGALRRDGIEWPTDGEGLPVYRLEILTQANGLEHGRAHDALSDVRATVAMAKLIRQAQPRLFDYYFKTRFKKQVRKLLEPFGAAVCLHVSGMYPRRRFCVAPVVSICRHPKNSNSIVVADLAQDIEPLLELTEDEIRARLFKEGAVERPPLKEIRINRCPFVAGIDVLTAENRERLEYDDRLIRERQRRLGKPGIAQKIMRVYGGREQPRAVDVDAALYDGFLHDDDRSRCRSFQEALRAGRWLDLDYRDKRLGELARRLKGRCFPELMNDVERADWHEFVAGKLGADDVPWLTLPRFSQWVSALDEKAAEAGAGNQREVLSELAEHASTLHGRYGTVAAT